MQKFSCFFHFPTTWWRISRCFCHSWYREQMQARFPRRRELDTQHPTRDVFFRFPNLLCSRRSIKPVSERPIYCACYTYNERESNDKRIYIVSSNSSLLSTRREDLTCKNPAEIFFFSIARSKSLPLFLAVRNYFSRFVYKYKTM